MKTLFLFLIAAAVVGCSGDDSSSAAQNVTVTELYYAHVSSNADGHLFGFSADINNNGAESVSGVVRFTVANGSSTITFNSDPATVPAGTSMGVMVYPTNRFPNMEPEIKSAVFIKQ